LLLAKNLTLVIVIAVEALGAVALLAALGFRPGWSQAATAFVMVFTALPALLAIGNVLSVRSPWRMTFRVGGAPQGAVASAFAQIAVLGGVAAFLGITLMLSRLVFGGSPLVPLACVLVEGVASWAVWALLLDGAGASFTARRERMIDALARPEETG